jgi:hypothetical protein
MSPDHLYLHMNRTNIINMVRQFDLNCQIVCRLNVGSVLVNHQVHIRLLAAELPYQSCQTFPLVRVPFLRWATCVVHKSFECPVIDWSSRPAWQSLHWTASPVIELCASCCTVDSQSPVSCRSLNLSCVFQCHFVPAGRHIVESDIPLIRSIMKLGGSQKCNNRQCTESYPLPVPPASQPLQHWYLVGGIFSSTEIVPLMTVSAFDQPRDGNLATCEHVHISDSLPTVVSSKGW